MITVIQVLTYPGLLFCSLMSFLTNWVRRKVVAHMQLRIGPLYTGPHGLLQPVADFLKLLFKEDIVTEVASARIPAVLLSLAIAATTTLTLMTNLAPAPLYAPYDIIVALYLLVWPTVTLGLLGYLAPGPYTVLGSSRILCLTIAYEVGLVVSLLVPVTLASRYLGAEYSLYLTCVTAWRLWSNPVTAVLLAVSLLTALLSLQCKFMLKPFDIPEAEQEIVAGFLTEYSGPKLALAYLLHDLEIYVVTTVLVLTYFGGGEFLGGGPVLNLILSLVEYLVVLTVLSAVHASLPRYRIEQALRLFWRYLLPVALVTLTLSLVL